MAGCERASEREKERVGYSEGEEESVNGERPKKAASSAIPG